MLHASSAGGRPPIKTRQLLSNSSASPDHLYRRRQNVPAFRAHRSSVGPSRSRTNLRKLPSLATLMASSARSPKRIPTLCRLAMMEVAVCAQGRLQRLRKDLDVDKHMLRRSRCALHQSHYYCPSSDIGIFRRQPHSP